MTGLWCQIDCSNGDACDICCEVEYKTDPNRHSHSARDGEELQVHEKYGSFAKATQAEQGRYEEYDLLIDQFRES